MLTNGRSVIVGLAAGPRRSRQHRTVAVGLAASGVLLAALALATGAAGRQAEATPAATPPVDLSITDAAVRHLGVLDLLVFELTVAGTAGGTVPEPVGMLDGAPVLAYVFPTTLAPAVVGFASPDGIVALAVTAHPDFDDTPLWDENGDGDPTNDGDRYHSHWVLLVPDDRVAGGLSVKAIETADPATVLPPTNAGLPIYLDSPGFAVRLDGSVVRVIVPSERAGGGTDFTFDAVTSSLVVNTSDPDQPTLGVTAVHDVLSGDLSLPYAVEAEGR